ncbi:replication endonuclease [Brucella pseudogrignonensis]|uniref:replication endonuclease n=1 Tax=Brucella pseudogrignonensis TaxID=419475 RepID=UPI003919AEEC
MNELFDRETVGGIEPFEPAQDCLSAEERLRFDIAELEEEEAGNTRGRMLPRHTVDFSVPCQKILSKETRTHKDVVRFLPPEWRGFLDKLSDVRRDEREQLILELVGWDGLEVLGLRPRKLREMAANKASEYALDWPCKDKNGNLINQHPDQRRRRDEKWHLRKIVKLQRNTILRVEGALKAVGGRNAFARPTYVSDYLLGLFREHVDLTEEILEGLRLVKVDDPNVQISMVELNEKAQKQAAAKRSLMIDMMLKRWQALGWHVCWITVTLPGEYVCHSTNEDKRISDHDPREFGPWQALEKIQDDMKVVLQILRNKKIRPSGMWCGQPQQSGSPHRHILLAVPTLEEARGICDEFRKKFSTRLKDDGKGQDRGCDARVIGDKDKRYSPKLGNNGTEETAMSAARYAARYSTRQEQKADRERIKKFEARKKEIGDRKLAGDELKEFQREQKAVKESQDSERYRAWKWIRRARTHTWIGLDSSRAPNEIWDVLWKCAQRGDREPEDARMALAMRHMLEVRKFSKLAEGIRAEIKALGSEVEEPDALPTSFENENDNPQRELLNKLLEGKAVTRPQKERLNEKLRMHSDAAATEAWHAAIAMGMWPDSDLDEVEIKWLREAVTEWEMSGFDVDETADSATIINRQMTDVDPLPPMPLRRLAENGYGEEVSQTIGAVGAVSKFVFENDVPLEAEIQKVADALGLAKAFKFALDTLVEKRNGCVLTVRQFRKVFFGLAKTAGFGLSKRPSGRLAIFDKSGEEMIKTPDVWQIVDEDTAAKMVQEYNSVFESENNTSQGVENNIVFNNSSPDNLHLPKRFGANAPPVGYVSPPGEIPF